MEVVTALNRLFYESQRGRNTGQGCDILSTCYVCDPQVRDLKSSLFLTQRRRKATENVNCREGSLLIFKDQLVISVLYNLHL